MTRSCPLPVDWLDYLDGIGDPSMTEHLPACRSCQEQLSSLRDNPPAHVLPRWTEGIVGHTEAVWTETTSANPSPAEFWYSAADFNFGDHFISHTKVPAPSFRYHDVDRVLVLVLSHPESDHYGWTDIVPVLSDIEAATETDLLFRADENTLGAPWRALFANQSKVARGQLDTRVGSLTEMGAHLLSQALAGEADEDRWGIELTGPYDQRARLDERLAEALKRLRTPWLLVQDHSDDELSADAAAVHAGQHSDTAELLWLMPRFAPEHEFALAAASSPKSHAVTWYLDTNVLKLTGTLRTDFARGMLVFLITNFQLATASRLRLHVIAAGAEFASAPFETTENEVELAKGVTSAQVDKLGAELVP